MIFASKKDDGGDDVGKVRDKFSVEVCKPEEQTDTFDRRVLWYEVADSSFLLYIYHL